MPRFSPMSFILCCSILTRSARSTSKGDSLAFTAVRAERWAPQHGMLKLCKVTL